MITHLHAARTATRSTRITISRGIVVVCAAALALTACSGTADSDTTTSPPVTTSAAPSPDSPSASPTQPDVEYATVSQYASVVAGERRTIEEYVVTVDECALGGWSEGSIVCPLAPMTLQALAGVLRISISQDAREEDRLLPPPPEIERLVNQTMEAAEDVEVAAEGLDSCDGYEGCEAEWITLRRAANRLQEEIDSWSPYL